MFSNLSLMRESCVAAMTVAPVFLAWSNIKSITFFALVSSRADVGSSAKMTLGLLATALAIATRWVSPTLRFCAFRFSFPVRPRSSIRAWTRF